MPLRFIDKWCNDLKSYKKLVPALQEFPHDILITADDDLFYEPEWLEKLYNAYLENPQIIHCHRAHYIQLNADGSLKNILNGNKAFPLLPHHIEISAQPAVVFFIRPSVFIKTSARKSFFKNCHRRLMTSGFGQCLS